MVNDDNMKPLAVSHYILELLRDTEMVASEVAEELGMTVPHTSSALNKLLRAGHITVVRKVRPANGVGATMNVYTSNYDKLKVKVYLTKDDVHYNIRDSEEVKVQRDPLVDAFFGNYKPSLKTEKPEEIA